MSMCCPDALLAAEMLPWRHVLVLAAINGRDHAEGRIPLRRVQAKTRMRPATILAILADLEAEGYIVRERGYSTGTTNPEGKRLATARLLALSARFAGTTWTAIAAADYETLPTAADRFDALRAAMLERALRGLVLTKPKTVRDFVRIGAESEGEHLPTPSVLTLHLPVDSQRRTNALGRHYQATDSERAPAALADQRTTPTESRATTTDDRASVSRCDVGEGQGACAGEADEPRARTAASARPTTVGART